MLLCFFILLPPSSYKHQLNMTLSYYRVTQHVKKSPMSHLHIWQAYGVTLLQQTLAKMSPVFIFNQLLRETVGSLVFKCYYIHQLIAFFVRLLLGAEQVEYRDFFSMKTAACWKSRLITVARLNKNSEIVRHKTKTMS